MIAEKRVRTTLSHEEPDQVAIFEVAFSNELASEILDKEALVHDEGSTCKKL